MRQCFFYRSLCHFVHFVLHIRFFFSFILIISLLAPKPSVADDLPVFCNENKKLIWYFEIGKTIFKIDSPEIGFHFLVSNDNPVAKQNSGPIGCRANPQKLVDFYLSGWPIRKKISKIQYPAIFNYVQLYNYPNRLGLHPSIDPDLINQKQQLSSCQDKKFLIRFDNGTILCSNSPEARNALSPLNLGKPSVDSDFDYLISSNLYRTPLGESFVAEYYQNDIEIKYLLKPDLFIRYGYTVPSDISEIGQSYIIEIDQVLRSSINEIEVTQ